MLMRSGDRTQKSDRHNEPDTLLALNFLSPFRKPAQVRSMRMVHGPVLPNAASRVALAVDRLTLAKRRWRGTAEDGAEFGFDLTKPLTHDSVFCVTEEACYVIKQKPEGVLEIALEGSADAAARVGWMLGNLHFPVEIAAQAIRVADDPAARQMLHREHVKFEARQQLFQPMKSGAHGHQH
jgi:urease accessory protein